MAIPKPLKTNSGKWTIQVMVNRKRIRNNFDTPEEAIAWAYAVKQQYSQYLGNSGQKYENKIRELHSIECKLPKKKKKTAIIREEFIKIDSMEGHAFEKYCANLLSLTNRFRGARFEVTQQSGDFGADVIVTCIDGTRVVIQCKRASSSIGIDAIQEAHTSKNHYFAKECGVITNSYFTLQAITLANETNTVLIDRKKLARIIAMYVDELNKIGTRNQWSEFLTELDNAEDIDIDKLIANVYEYNID